MKHTLMILSLSMALLPPAAAEQPAQSSPAPARAQAQPEQAEADAPAAQRRAEEAARKERQRALFTCVALSRPLPGGGRYCVAGAGDMMHTARYAAGISPVEDVGAPAPVPENRVTRALNCPEAQGLPDNWYDDKYTPLWKEDALIPADKVLELWYAALESLWVPVSWFCDASGDNLVIISGRAANCHCYEMYLYQWDAERQGYARRGVYTYYSRLLQVFPTRVEFRPDGMSVTGRLLTQKGNTMEYRHIFRHADGNQTVRFPDENLRWVIGEL